MISAKWVAYILIAMIALQSVTVVAETEHQIHPEDEQNQIIDTDNEYKVVKQNSASVKDKQPLPSGELDCHHCGHCHNPPQLEFISNNNFNFSDISGLSTDYLFDYISKLFTPTLRPPIV